MTFQPSHYQENIFNWITNGKGHAVVMAVAGSGKTTSLVEASKLLPTNITAIFLAFNKHIATELGAKLKEQGSTMQAMTIHSLGLQALRQLGIRTTIKSNKYHDLCKNYLISKDAYEYQVLTQLKKLVSFSQLTLIAPTQENLLKIIDHYSLEISPFDDEWPIIWKGVKPILDAGIGMAKTQGIIDFNDMVWLPSMLNLKPAKADWIFIDESQDLNAAQLEIVMKSVNGIGRLLFCGDERQSLYGFSGADTESIKKIIARTGATTLPLSICYRCPKSHIEICQEIVPEIEAAPTAKEGTIEYIKPDKLSEYVKPGDLVLCRTTAPLVETCLSLIREGVRAKVRGSDLGANFIATIKKLANPRLNMDTFVETVNNWRDQQAAFIGVGEDSEMKVAALDDKVDTMKALQVAYLTERKDDFHTLDGFYAYIEQFFSDEFGPVVMLSTVHKAKGLEEKRVFILHPEKMPHPKAKSGWQHEQEMNIKYVAFSRSKDALYFVQEVVKESEQSVEHATTVEPVVETPTTDETPSVVVAKNKGGRPKKEREEKAKYLQISLYEEEQAMLTEMAAALTSKKTKHGEGDRSELIRQWIREKYQEFALSHS